MDRWGKTKDEVGTGTLRPLSGSAGSLHAVRGYRCAQPPANGLDPSGVGAERRPLDKPELQRRPPTRRSSNSAGGGVRARTPPATSRAERTSSHHAGELARQSSGGPVTPGPPGTRPARAVSGPPLGSWLRPPVTAGNVRPATTVDLHSAALTPPPMSAPTAGSPTTISTPMPPAASPNPRQMGPSYAARPAERELP